MRMSGCSSRERGCLAAAGRCAFDVPARNRRKDGLGTRFRPTPARVGDGRGRGCLHAGRRRVATGPPPGEYARSVSDPAPRCCGTGHVPRYTSRDCTPPRRTADRWAESHLIDNPCPPATPRSVPSGREVTATRPRGRSIRRATRSVAVYARSAQGTAVTADVHVPRSGVAGRGPVPCGRRPGA